jgi:hypothetical protein
MTTDQWTRRPGGSQAARLRGITALVIGAAALVVLTLLLVPGSAAAASENPDAEYYVSTVTAIDPPVAGLEVVVHGNGESVTLSNRTNRQVIVLGYSGEEYLRFTTSGVSVNTNSLTAALNANGGRSAPPAAVSGKAKPARWRPVATSSSFTWQDFRTRWSADERPPIVAADPHARHQVFAWAIQLKVDSKPTLVRGQVTWTGAPRFNQTALLGVGGAVVLIVAGLLAIGVRRRGRRRQSARVIPLVRSDERTAHPTGAR